MSDPQRKEALIGQILGESLEELIQVVNIAVHQVPTRRPLSSFDFRKCDMQADVSFRVFADLPAEPDEFLDRENRNRLKKTLINDPEDQCARSFNSSSEAEKIRSLLESFGRL